MKEKLPNPSDELPIFYGCDPESNDLVEHFSHFVLAVSDLDRSEAWYHDIIGMDLLGRNLTAEGQPHSVLEMNTGQLFILVQQEAVDAARVNSHGVHHGFALTQNQFRRAMSRLEANGYTTSAEREEFIARGQYSVDVYDPDGHHYQIETMDEVQAHEPLFTGAGLIDCGPAVSFAIGDVRTFREGNFFLVRLEEGFLAPTRWCSHMNGMVIYQKEHWRFWCAMHTATYDRRGVPTCTTTRFPDLHPLRLHPVHIDDDGHVLVDSDRVIERTSYERDQAVQSASVAAR